MANYVYIVDDKIEGIYDLVPDNWRNISNFYVLSDEELLQHGWHKLVKIVPEFDPETQKLDTPLYTFVDGVAYETMQVFDLPPAPLPDPGPSQEEIQVQIEEQWNNVRLQRDKLMEEFQWRYVRYDRQVRLNIPTTDDITIMDAYMQSLADITLQSNPYAIEWPIYLP